MLFISLSFFSVLFLRLSLTQKGAFLIEIMHEEVSEQKDQRGTSGLDVASRFALSGSSVYFFISTLKNESQNLFQKTKHFRIAA